MSWWSDNLPYISNIGQEIGRQYQGQQQGQIEAQKRQFEQMKAMAEMQKMYQDMQMKRVPSIVNLYGTQYQMDPMTGSLTPIPRPPRMNELPPAATVRPIGGGFEEIDYEDPESGKFERKFEKITPEKTPKDIANESYLRKKGELLAVEEAFKLPQDSLDYYTANTVLTGKLPAIGFGESGTIQRTQIVKNIPKWAKANGYVNLTDVVLKGFEVKADQSALTQVSKIGELSRTYEMTAVDFLNRLPALREKVSGIGFKKWDQFQREFETGWTGDPDTINLKAQLYDALVESGKVITGQFGIAGMPEGARQKMETLLQASDNPITFQKVIETLKINMRQRNENLDKTRENILVKMGKSRVPSEPGKKAKENVPKGTSEKVLKYNPSTGKIE